MICFRHGLASPSRISFLSETFYWDSQRSPSALAIGRVFTHARWMNGSSQNCDGCCLATEWRKQAVAGSYHYTARKPFGIKWVVFIDNGLWVRCRPLFMILDDIHFISLCFRDRWFRAVLCTQTKCDCVAFCFLRNPVQSMMVIHVKVLISLVLLNTTTGHGQNQPVLSTTAGEL